VVSRFFYLYAKKLNTWEEEIKCRLFTHGKNNRKSQNSLFLEGRGLG